MTSSARASNDGGMIRPSALAALRFTTQFECDRLVDRKISGFGTVEDLSGINAGLAIGSRDARSVAHQAAGLSEFAVKVDRRDGVARCQRH